MQSAYPCLFPLSHKFTPQRWPSIKYLMICSLSLFIYLMLCFFPTISTYTFEFLLVVCC